MTRFVKFQLHIDHIDNPDGDVWAVRYGKTYKTAHRFVMYGVPVLVGDEVRATQPRAFVSGRGRVQVIADGDGRRTIVISGLAR
jgi:hypothetical protein